MGFSESGSRCRKHPRQQSPGVCSFCLREKLSQLSAASTAASNNTNSCSSSSSISSCSSLSDSSYSSPSHHLYSDANGRMPFVMATHDGFFARSRTVAFSAPLRPVSASTFAGERKKKGGFWSRLLRPNSKRRKEVFLHSQTMKEIPSTHVNTRA